MTFWTAYFIKKESLMFFLLEKNILSNCNLKELSRAIVETNGKGWGMTESFFCVRNACELLQTTLRHCGRNKRSNGWSELRWDYWHLRTGALPTGPIFISVILEHCWKTVLLALFLQVYGWTEDEKSLDLVCSSRSTSDLTDFRFQNLLVLCVF